MTKIKNWKVLKSITIDKTPWTEVLRDECEVDGKRLMYTYTKRLDEGPTIIPEESNGRLWLVQQYRHPIRKVIWQFPVEGKHVNESWEEAAHRAVMEEVRKKADSLIDLGEMFIDPGGLQQKTRYFLARGLHSIPQVEVYKEEFENLHAGSFSREELEKMIEIGDICDGWTLVGLFLYDRYVAQGSGR